MRRLDAAGLEQNGPKRRDRGGHPQLRAGVSHADGRPGIDGRLRANRRPRRNCMACSIRSRKPASYAHQCLVARRLIERGVRFVELTCPQVAADRWDQHSRLREGHELNALATDKPIAGLLTDLKSRGLLDDTLVIWAGEFGRTPMAQGSDGRDHNPFGFTIWMAGGGVKPGFVYRRDRRVRLLRDRKQARDVRPARDDAAPAWPRPQAAHLPLQLPRHATDRRARPGGPPDRRLALARPHRRRKLILFESPTCG